MRMGTLPRLKSARKLVASPVEMANLEASCTRPFDYIAGFTWPELVAIELLKQEGKW